jgi:hypothetical protein
MKRQRRGHRVPKAKVGSVMQVPKNALDRLPMRSPWRRLKTSAQTYRELDVRPHRRCWRLMFVSKFVRDSQAYKSPVVIKGPFFPRVVNPRYRIRGTNVWRKN